ncbi:MAG: hypothetical protein ILP07_09355 [Treponema sp.]|nr:hypothetical protein [Treponema sp.]
MHDTAETKKSIEIVLEAREYVDKFYEENGMLPGEDDEYFINHKLKFESYEEGDYNDFTLYYKDAYMRKSDEKVRLCPRP